MRKLVLLLALLAAAARADTPKGNITSGIPEYHAQDATAAVVTEKNLLASERFWPYQVALVGPWQPPGSAQPLAADASGVLIRVDASGKARIDFGRDGLFEVPVGKTDLVKRANRIRLGELDKLAPNFVLAIGPRVLDSAADPLRPLSFGDVASQRAFLCVFADPDAKEFAALAAALAPLRERPGVLTIFFPQGAHPDAQVRERLRGVKWMVPFLASYLSEPYARTLLSDATPPPSIQLQTPEGRVVFESRWDAGIVSQLTSALDKGIGAASPVAERGPGR